MKWLTNNKVLSEGTFNLLSDFIGKMTKPVAAKLARYATRKATPEAREFASERFEKLCSKIPTIVADLTSIGISIASKGFSPAAGAELANVAADAFMNKKSSLRQLAKLPVKAYKAYKGFKALNKEAGPSLAELRLKHKPHL